MRKNRQVCGSISAIGFWKDVVIDAKNKDEAIKFLTKLNSELMKIAKSGIIKKQNASRNVSRITKKISAI